VAIVAVSAPVRVGVYARISSDRDGDQLGVTRQIEDSRRLAAQRGWIVADVYVDDDVSAWSGKARPEYERLLDDLRSGLIGGVVVWHLDRLHRHPRDLEAFLDLCDEVGTDKLGCVTGEVDLATITGRLTARMLGGLAKYESDHKSERNVRKHQELAQRGKVSGGGSRPYGYEPDKITVRPAEAAIVKEVARRFLAGESLRSIVLDLNERGEGAAGGGPWSPQTLRRMLGSARIAGQREHHGEVVADAEWPGIITPAESVTIRARLADPTRRTNKAARRYLLHGLLRCGRCGEKLVARPRAGGQRRYGCVPDTGGCGKTYIKAEDVEQFIEHAVLDWLDSPELARALDGRSRSVPESARWWEESEAAQAQLDELATAYGEKQFTLSEWLAARKPIEQRLSTARKQLAKATRTSVLESYIGNGDALRRDWNSLDLSQQHAIVSEVVDHIVVGPGRPGYNRFDESRLTAFWRP
jgi:site-specific DNA recombinase